MNDLKWTGERYLPAIGGEIELEHKHRYLACLDIVRDKIVLDIASGEGYGSSMLAGSASEVVGVDISDEAVEFASTKYSLPNLSYRQGACDAIPADDDSFDVVVSFETIEHHAQHEEMMQEISRVLKPEGILIISSPDKLEYSDKTGQNNEYHVKELYKGEFCDLLGRYFSEVHLYGQAVRYGSLIMPASDRKVPTRTLQDDPGRKNHDGLREPIYLIAIAANHPIEDDLCSVFEARPEQLPQGHAPQDNGALLQLDNHVQHLRNECIVRFDQIAGMQKERSATLLELTRAQIHAANMETDRQRIAEEQNRTAEQLAAAKAEFAEEQDRSAERLALVKAEFAALESETAARVATLQGTVDDLSAKLVVCEAELAECHQLRIESESLKARLSLRETDVNHLESEIDYFAGRLQELAALGRRSEEQLRQAQLDLATERSAHHDTLQRSANELAAIRASTSWRLSAPIRWVKRLVSG